MKKRKILFTLLSAIAMMFLSLGTVTQIQAQTTTPVSFSGQAVGLIANADVAGGSAVVNARIADTLAFNANSSTNFERTVTVADAETQIQLGGVLAGSTVGARLITTNTSGGPNNTPTPNTSDSTATVNDLDFRLLGNAVVTTGVTVTATNVQSTSFCQCTNTGPRCTGTTTIKDLRVNGFLVGSAELPFVTLAGSVTVNADGTITAAPNTRISLLGGTVILTLNEQIVTNFNNSNTQEITVNALRIGVNIPGLATTDVIVSQSTSDICCTATQIQQTTPVSFSGQAVGLIANADVVGGSAVVNARIADTLAFNQTGDFDKTVTVADAATRIQLGEVLAGSTVGARLITTNTSGGPNNTPTPNTSDSTATVNDLDFRLLGNAVVTTGVTVTATNVQSTSFCQCTNTGPRCTGTTTIKNLRINNFLVGTDLPFVTLAGSVIVNADGTITAAPNSQIRLTVLGGTVTLTLNEQIVTNSTDGNTQEITVNALRIGVNIPGLATTDVIVAQSTSDIQCTVGPTAAPVSISGRVISPFGRGIASARIFLTNSMGEKQTAMTNRFGYFSFKEIGSGENYVVEITHKSYIFTPQVLLVTNDLTELNFTGLPYGKSGGKSKFIPGN